MAYRGFGEGWRKMAESTEMPQQPGRPNSKSIKNFYTSEPPTFPQHKRYEHPECRTAVIAPKHGIMVPHDMRFEGTTTHKSHFSDGRKPGAVRLLSQSAPLSYFTSSASQVKQSTEERPLIPQDLRLAKGAFSGLAGKDHLEAGTIGLTGLNSPHGDVKPLRTFPDKYSTSALQPGETGLMGNESPHLPKHKVRPPVPPLSTTGVAGKSSVDIAASNELGRKLGQFAIHKESHISPGKAGFIGHNPEEEQEPTNTWKSFPVKTHAIPRQMPTLGGRFYGHRKNETDYTDWSKKGKKFNDLSIARRQMQLQNTSFSEQRYGTVSPKSNLMVPRRPRSLSPKSFKC